MKGHKDMTRPQSPTSKKSFFGNELTAHSTDLIKFRGFS